MANTASLGPLGGTAIAGNVHGGQQPISGGRIYLLAANPSGYGSASVSLLTSALTGNAVDTVGAYVTSSSTGGFDITGDYSCTTGYAQGASTSSGGITLPGDEQLYLYVQGGNPGLNSGTNSSIGLLAALGPCNAQFSQFLQVNEITTVAAAYALAGFATDALHVSSSGSTLALTGLANAGLNAQNLANLLTGLPPDTTAGRNGLVPASNVITIANILAACINGATGNSSCSTLFASTGSGGVAATDTATAAINLAHKPYPGAAEMTALYGLVTATPAFGGGLAAQPNDFALGITFSNAGCFNNSAYGVAIDASGNVWSLGGHGLCKFSNNGVPATNVAGNGYTGGGYNSGLNLAIDTAGNVWVADPNFNRLAKFSNSGAPLSPSSGYTGGGLYSARGVAIDASNNVWVANGFGSSLSKFSSTGTALSGSNGYLDGGNNVNFYGVAIDIAGNAWAANVSNGSFSKFSNAGVQLSPNAGYYGNGLGSVYAVAIDAMGNVWGPNYYGDTIGEVSASGAGISPTGGYRGGGLDTPYSIAIDSGGQVWASNFNNNTISAFSSTGVAISPSTGYKSNGSVYGPVNIAVDNSGNVWTANYQGALTQFVGAAAPVATPIAANLVAPYGTSAINRP